MKTFLVLLWYKLFPPRYTGYKLGAFTCHVAPTGRTGKTFVAAAVKGYEKRSLSKYEKRWAQKKAWVTEVVLSSKPSELPPSVRESRRRNSYQDQVWKRDSEAMPSDQSPIKQRLVLVTDANKEKL